MYQKPSVVPPKSTKLPEMDEGIQLYEFRNRGARDSGVSLNKSELGMKALGSNHSFKVKHVPETVRGTAQIDKVTRNGRGDEVV